MPNCNMSTAGYAARGARGDTPEYARAVPIVDARRFALGNHGSLGLVGVPGSADIARARAARSKLEALSPLARTAPNSQLRRGYLSLRDETLPNLEAQNLINQALLMGTTPSTAVSATPS